MNITLAEATNVNGSGVATFANPCAANDLIVIFGETVQSGLVPAGAADNVNPGIYSSISSLFNSAVGKQVSAFYKKCTTAGVPTVTCSGGAAGVGVAMRFTGFSIGPSLVTPDQAVGWPTTSTTAVNSGNVNASQSAELFVALQQSLQNNSSGGTGWTSSGVFFNAGISASYKVGVASGTAESFTATLAAADFPYALIQGFIDGTIAPSVPDIGQAAPAFIRHTQTPTTGFSIAVAGITQLVLTPAGTLATGTITLPPNPGDNQPFMAMTSQTITALTVNTSDGTTIPAAPTTLSNTSAIKLIFQAASNSWIREQ